MNPPQTDCSPVNRRCKELRRMSRKLNRILDVLGHVTIVFLALYVGIATFVVGVA